MVRHDVRARYVWHISKSDLENNLLEQALEEAMELGVVMSTLMIVDDLEGTLQHGQDLVWEAFETGGIGIGNDHVVAY